MKQALLFSNLTLLFSSACNLPTSDLFSSYHVTITIKLVVAKGVMYRFHNFCCSDFLKFDFDTCHESGTKGSYS